MASNIRQMPPIGVLRESPARLGLHVTMVQLAVYADLTPRLTRIGITSPSRRTAMAHIAAHPGCTQSELALYTGLSRAAAMTMVDQLQSSNLVERRAGQDGRSNALHLTAAGRRALKTIEVESEANEKEIFGCLSPEEREALRTLLEKVIRNVAAKKEEANQGDQDEEIVSNGAAHDNRLADGSIRAGC
jgi:DNA-binding MarR family transcriptional regulator